MKKLFILIVLTLLVGANANAGGYRLQKGYYKKSSGTIVQPHFKTNPDKNLYNNRKYLESGKI